MIVLRRKRSDSVAGAKLQALPQVQARIENRKPHDVILDKRADGGGHVYPAAVKHGPEAPAQSCIMLRQSTNLPSHSSIDYLLSAAYTSPICTSSCCYVACPITRLADNDYDFGLKDDMSRSLVHSLAL